MTIDLNSMQFNDNNQTLKNKPSLSKIMVLTTSTDFYMLHCLTWIVGFFGILCSIVVHYECVLCITSYIKPA